VSGGAVDERIVDAAGLCCPVPVIRLAAAARNAPEGTVITLVSDDPAAGADVAAWCRMRGHALLEQRAEPPGVLLSRVQVRRTPPAGAG
jgi:tRNA 2-thiouridine synthesizing protein A